MEKKRSFTLTHDQGLQSQEGDRNNQAEVFDGGVLLGFHYVNYGCELQLQDSR